MAPRVLGLAAVQINFLVNTILASGLVAGSLAALNYGWLLMLLPQGIFAQSVATAAFPTFSTQAAKGQRAEMRSALAATLRAVLYLAVPAAVGLIVLSRPVVQLVFERGAFTEASTTMVSGALTLYALALPAHSVVELVVRAFYALHDTKTPVMVGVGAMGLNVVLSILLIRVFDDLGWMPLGGLALGNSLATTAEMVVLLVLVRRRLRGLEGRQAIDSLVRIGFASALMGVASGVLAWLLAAQGIWLSAGIAMIAGLVVYVGVTLLLRTREPRTLWHLLTHRGGAALGAPR
jgi:putative peptidoglycan lipid II flippase